MSSAKLLAGAVLALMLFACATPTAPPMADIVYADGQWWDGERFVRGDRYVRGGRFIEADAAMQRVELEGAYVVPPLVDGHVHDFHTPAFALASVSNFVRDGIFTALEMGGETRQLEDARASLAAMPITVRFAGSILTSPGGHPIPYVEAPALGLNWWSLTRQRQAEVRQSRTMEGNGYFAIGDAVELDHDWRALMRQRPDHVKLVLWGENGLAPDLALTLAARARAAGLPVAAHVQTRADADVALDIGADLLAHLPDYDSVAELPSELVERMAMAGVTVVPTLARELAMEQWAPPSARRNDSEAAALRQSHALRLRQLHGAGVNILPGADLNGMTALDELIYWQAIGAFDGGVLLAIATAGLPERWRGGGEPHCLERGCRADFIVMEEDPRIDIAAYRKARLRIRAGREVGAALERVKGIEPSS